MQDKEIIRQIQHGHKELLQDVIEKYYDEVLHFCMYQIRDTADAYDLTQETFCRFIRCVDTYECRNLKGYLLTIARNLCMDYLRNNRMIEPLARSESIGEISPQETNAASGSPDAYSQAEDQMLLSRLLCEIPAKQREVIVLRYYHELKYNEIAKILGVNLSTVKSRLRLGIRNLQKRWSQI